MNWNVIFPCIVLFNCLPVFSSINYDVQVVERPDSPILSFLDKTSIYQQVMNPSWVEASPGTGGVKGIVARTQNCVSNVGDACVFCGGSEAKASFLTFSEEISPNVYKPIDEDSYIFGPSDSTDSWGTEDPRIQYNRFDGLYYMFYTAYNGSAIKLSLATTSNPASSKSEWTRHGPVFPELEGTKSAALLIRNEPPHYLFWGDHDIRVTKSDDVAVWADPGSILLSPRTDNFDSQLVESGPPPLLLSTGDYLFFYNSAELNWPSDESTAYHVGWIILSGADPTQVLQRSSSPLMGPEFAWEKGVSPYACNVPNVVFLEAAAPIGDDTFRVFFGAADANLGTAVIKVQVRQGSHDVDT